MEPTRIKKLISAQESCLSIIRESDEWMRKRWVESLPPLTITARINSLEKTWQDAKLAESEIRASLGDSHAYFTSGLFQSIQQAYEEALGYLVTLAFDANRVPVKRSSSELVDFFRVKLPRFSNEYQDQDGFFK